MSGPDEGRPERNQPARDAAKRASASFAEQLMSSPTRSDDDHSENDGTSNPFGESSSRKTKNVKYRYSATGKHLSSPLRGKGSSSPERKEKKPQPKPKQKPLLAPSSSYPTTSTSSASRKRKASLAPTLGHGTPSSLSTLSSPLSSMPTSPNVITKGLPATKETIPDLPGRRHRSKTLSLVPFRSSVSKASPSLPLSSPRKKRVDKGKASVDSDAWDVGRYVWVLVNQSGSLAGIDTRGDGDDDNECVEEPMWWPAQIVQKEPLRASLFGDFPTSSLSPRGPCTIQSPSPANIQSIYDVTGANRFDRFTFRLHSSYTEGLASPSPSKKPRLDGGLNLEERWEAAARDMENASSLERDGLPSLISSYASIGGNYYDSLDDSEPDPSNLRATALKPKPKSVQKLKSQRSKANLQNTPKDDSKRWSPCPPDPTLQIPGELVLAQAPGPGSLYWPAQILAHVPDRRERYRVKYLDDKEYVISRDKFHTAEEKGFVNCTLGKWESAIKTTDDPESEDEDEPEDENQDLVPGPPPPPEDFEDLSVQAQLAYVKPVLRSILAKEYVPTLAKHTAFMKGGNARAGVLQSASIRGGMDTRFIKALQRAICRWVLGKTDGPAQRSLGEINGTGGESITNAPEPLLDRGEMGEISESDKMQEIEGHTVSANIPSDTGNHVEVSLMAVDEAAQPSENAAISISQTSSDEPMPMQINEQADLLLEEPQVVAPEASSELEASQPHLSAVLPDDQPQHLPSVAACREFECLSAVEKLDYCLNILLPESIQQLLLWRSGERTSIELLPEGEEQRLHDLSTRKANETDWVDDVMRLRAAQARLWGVDLDKRLQEKKIVPGGTKSRPRRVSK